MQCRKISQRQRCTSLMSIYPRMSTNHISECTGDTISSITGRCGIFDRAPCQYDARRPVHEPRSTEESLHHRRAAQNEVSIYQPNFELFFLFLQNYLLNKWNVWSLFLTNRWTESVIFVFFHNRLWIYLCSPNCPCPVYSSYIPRQLDCFNRI